MHSRNTKYSLFLIALSFACSLGRPALAQDDPAALRRQMDMAYEEILKNPQDRKLTLQYAAIAMQLKDYEAAIPPLERILMNEPDNAKIKVQVGVLYQALGSRLLAKQYFTDAINTPGASQAIVNDAETRLRGL